MRVLSRKERRRLAERGPAATRSSRASGRAGRRSCSDHRVPLAVGRADRHARARRSRRCRCAWAPPTPGRTRRPPPRARPTTCSPRASAPGFNGTFQIVARTPNGKADLPKAAAARRQRCSHDRRPGRASARRCRRPNGKVALIEARPTTAPQDAATSDLIDTLRNDVVPRASGGLPVYVGGITAIFDDFAGVLTDKLPLFIAVIVAARLPAADDRVPQHADPAHRGGDEPARGGRGVRRRDRSSSRRASSPGRSGVGTGPIEAFLPVMMLAILFGLSMDYQVFLVSRMHEEWVQHRRQRPLGADRPGRDRPRDHRGGDDHDLRLRLRSCSPGSA